MFKAVKRLFKLLIFAGLVVLICPNFVDFITQHGNIKSFDDLVNEVSYLQEDLLAGDPGAAQTRVSEHDCIVVMGAAVNPDGTPSTILADRIKVAVDLYNAGVAPKIIMSGDNQSERETYDEVTHMKRYAVEVLGVPSEDVFCDHAGINTYDSMYRLYHVFGAERPVIVTQTYHLYRTLADASSFSMDAVGVAADLHAYANIIWYQIREFLARISDAWKVLTRADATYLSEPVSLDQSGDVTTWQY